MKLHILKSAVLATALTLAGAVAASAEETTLYYEIHGEGAPLVLLHGAFLTIQTNWSAVLGDLAASHQVIAVELQGHGHTADRDGPLSYEAMADDVAVLLESLDIPSAAILGYSMGGNVALQTALRHPGRVDSLVLISAAASDTGYAEEHKAFLPYLSADIFAGTPLVAEYEATSPAPDFPALVEKLKALELTPFDWTDQLGAIDVPVLIVAGDSDVVTLQHLTELYAGLGGTTHGDLTGLSDTRLAILPGATHMGILYDPTHAATVSRLTLDFLAEAAE